MKSIDSLEHSDGVRKPTELGGDEARARRQRALDYDAQRARKAKYEREAAARGKEK